jgi:hypothetical protein
MPSATPIKYGPLRSPGSFDRENLAVTLIKIIIITLAVILSILFFGRFLF